MKNTRSTILTAILILVLIALSIWFRAHITVMVSLGGLLLTLALMTYKNASFNFRKMLSILSILRWLLLPFSLTYGAIIWFRNQCYDWAVFSTNRFPVRSIVIGNLVIGGAGKSPLTQKLVQHFKADWRTATLSRGYGRATKGFRLVQLTDSANDVGDEPLQFKKNHPEITVAVDENRTRGIEILQKSHDLIVLDDAFQHRKITADCYILLFDYESITHRLWMLPTGDLRDTLDQIKRAYIVLITKCPKTIPPAERLKIERKIRRRNKKCTIHYSQIAYHHPIHIPTQNPFPIKQLADPFILITGIANPKPLLRYLQDLNLDFEHLAYPDHHRFSNEDYIFIRKKVDSETQPKVILTTEKDAQRLDLKKLDNIAIYYIPIAIALENDAKFFNDINGILQKKRSRIEE